MPRNCRAYSIHDAIEKFLSNIYAPSAVDDHYDYIPGEGSCGVLVYDDKFAYSHPVKGWYCVEIIDVREDDDDAPLAMCELCGCAHVRYVHVVENDLYFEPVAVGCICAGIMEGDILAVEERERQMRNHAKRKRNFLKHEWRKGYRGFWYRTYRGQEVQIREFDGKYSVRAGSKVSNRYKRKPITDLYSSIYAAFELAARRWSRPSLRNCTPRPVTCGHPPMLTRSAISRSTATATSGWKLRCSFGDDFALLHDFLLRNGYITEEPEADAPVEDSDVEVTEDIALSADAEATDEASENDAGEADADLEAPVEDSEAETADDEEDTERGDDMKPITANTEESADNVSNGADSDLEEEQHPGDASDATTETTAPADDSDPDTQTITIPAPDITVEQLRNLTFILYSRQYLLGLMTGAETIHIPMETVQSLQRAMPDTPEDFTALLNSHKALGLKGFDFKDGQFTLTFPFCESDPAKWTTFAELQGHILQAALAAKRVLPDLIQPEEEAEKYTAHIWLQRMSYKGPEMKEQRNILLKHLHGYCAFSNGTKMQNHKDKYSAIRRERREAEHAAAQTIVETVFPAVIAPEATAPEKEVAINE